MAEKTIHKVSTGTSGLNILKISYHIDSIVKELGSGTEPETGKFRLVALDILVKGDGNNKDYGNIYLGAVGVDDKGGIKRGTVIFPCPPDCGKQGGSKGYPVIKNIGEELRILATTSPFGGDFLVDEIKKLKDQGERNEHCQLVTVQLAPNHCLTGFIGTYVDETTQEIKSLSGPDHKIILPQ